MYVQKLHVLSVGENRPPQDQSPTGKDSAACLDQSCCPSPVDHFTQEMGHRIIHDLLKIMSAVPVNVPNAINGDRCRLLLRLS